MKQLNKLILVLVLPLVMANCNKDKSQSEANQNLNPGEHRIAVVLANHGSRSKTWRTELLKLEENVKQQVLANPGVIGVATAFMEYNEPSIATRLKEFDAQGATDIIIVPIFLTVSTHSFDDIPTIAGQKENAQSVKEMRLEKIERYKPKAKVTITPLLDFKNILQENVLRRALSMSKSPKDEGITLIAYGDATYEKEWKELMDSVAAHVKDKAGIDTYSYGWCGHLVKYDPQKTTEAIEEVLAKKKRSIVLPILVAYDEMFQGQIIGDGIKKIKDHEERVLYHADSILPDIGVEKWVTDIVHENVTKILSSSTEAPEEK
ncbi:MAG: CbiX/SirB N-terminal domain-containing protein [Leptonema sp. (in: Bacteria)]|nr:CbiX/SirB N-terminal domain-containing protein [Leptonema sp. (in: bacteria)]